MNEILLASRRRFLQSALAGGALAGFSPLSLAYQQAARKTLGVLAQQRMRLVAAAIVQRAHGACEQGALGGQCARGRLWQGKHLYGGTP